MINFLYVKERIAGMTTKGFHENSVIEHFTTVIFN